MKTSLLILAIYTSLISLVLAADADGRFAIRNAGMQSCETFVKEKSKKSSKFNLYAGWIDGYISAANQYTDNTFDIVPWGNTLFLTTLIENHCKKNPQQKFYMAVNQLMAVLFEHRLQKQSPLVETTHKGKKSYIYQDVLKKLQQQLKKQGLYQNTASGKFDTATRLAIEKFQQKNKIAITGLPDQLTLYLVYKAILQTKK